MKRLVYLLLFAPALCFGQLGSRPGFSVGGGSGQTEAEVATQISDSGDVERARIDAIYQIESDVSSIVNDSLDAQRPFGGDPTSEISDSLTENRARDDAAYHPKGDTLGLSGRIDLKSPIASPTFTGTVTIPTPFTLGAVSVLPTGTELNYVDGVTSAIQTQINTKVTGDIDSLEYDSELGAIRGHANSGDTIPLYTPYADRINIGDVAVLINDNNSTLEAYQYMGSSIKAMPIGMTLADVDHTLALVDGYIVWVAVYLLEDAIITGVKYIMETQGAYTADNYNGFGLYTVTESTLDSVAATANDHTMFETAAGVHSVAFTSPYNATKGLYYIAVVYNESANVTIPKLYSGIAYGSAFNGFDFADGLMLFASRDVTTTLPNTFDAGSFYQTPLRYFLTLY